MCVMIIIFLLRNLSLLVESKLVRDMLEDFSRRKEVKNSYNGV